MIQCMSCKETFLDSEAVTVKEETGVFCQGFAEAMTICYCPYCGSVGLAEMTKCEGCGQWTADVDSVCEDCYAFAKKVLTTAIEVSAGESGTDPEKQNMPYVFSVVLEREY